jgi:hypothetical protein
MSLGVLRARFSVKTPISAILRKCGYTLSKSVDFSAPPDEALFRNLAPQSANQKFTIALVGTSTEGLNGFGKVSQSLYFPKFGHTLAKWGISLIAYRSPDHALHNIRSSQASRSHAII